MEDLCACRVISNSDPAAPTSFASECFLALVVHYSTEFAGVRSILPISKGGTRNQAIPEGLWELGNKHLLLKISVISIGPQATEYCRVL